MCKKNGKHNKRALILTENEESVFRFDINITGRDFIEYDIFNALNDMEKKGLINLKKIFNMLKAEYGLTLSDSIEVYKDIITGKGENWKIIPEDIKENKEEFKSNVTDERRKQIEEENANEIAYLKEV